MFLQSVFAFFIATEHACRVINTDLCFAETLSQTLSRLPPIKISERYSTVQEWINDYEETEPGHRHISQLFGLYPGDSINESNPQIYEAVKRTIARHIENGGGSTGWSRAWTICFYARLKDGNNAENHIKYLLRKCTADNLFDIHPPFQIDGNFGGVAGITEMLIQSHLGSPDKRTVERLPALPESWTEGSIEGIKARGNLTSSLWWSDGILKKVEIISADNSEPRIKLNARTEKLFTAFCVKENNTVTLNLKANEISCIE